MYSLKNKHRILPILLCSISLILVSCGGDDGNSTGPEPPEEPEQDRAVSFSQDISPIFTGTCAGSACHSAGNQESGVDLSSYDAALNSVGNQYGTEVINPGNPDNSPLVDKIEENPEFGTRMPQGLGPLNQADIDSIRAWIEDGAPNN